MASFKFILTIVFAVNVFGICLVGFHYVASSDGTRILMSYDEVILGSEVQPELEPTYTHEPGSKSETKPELRSEPVLEPQVFLRPTTATVKREAETMKNENPILNELNSADLRSDEAAVLELNEEKTTEEPEQVLLQEPEFVEEAKNKSHRFEDTALATRILELLDVVEKPAEKDMTEMDRHTYFTHFNKYFMGLTADDEYCQKHREYFVNHPEYIFDGFNIFSEYHPSSIIRKSIIPKVGNDSMPHVGYHMDYDLQGKHQFDFNLNISYFYSEFIIWSREVGTQFSCLTQMSNHIPGHVMIYRKDFAAQALHVYKKKYENRPHCLNTNKFFPESWLLTDKDQCQEFFRLINIPEYEDLKQERGIVYIRKVAAGSHAAYGVAPVNQTEEEDLRELYGNGENCGTINKNYLIQKMVHNPLLIRGSKFDMRVFMFIASTNPAIVYFHRDTIVWASTELYNNNTADKGGFVPNASFNSTVSDIVWRNGTYNGMTRDQLRDHATQTLEELEAYLLQAGKITDSKWIDKYLRPEFAKAIAHVIRMGQSPFMKHSSLYEIMGVDFILDDHLDLWFIEANTHPSLIEYSHKETKILTAMLTDQFEIARGLLRSRTKRIINYVNFLIKENKAWTDENGASFDDFELRRAEFKEISKNYFEAEFRPSATNGFILAVDDNVEGTARYAGNLPEDCF